MTNSLEDEKRRQNQQAWPFVKEIFMSKTKKIISPISIDLGYKNTGVFFAHYEEGADLDKIEKSGKVFQLDKNAYTYLMVGRTAARHQKRGYDRRQMAKRLFKLIWEKHLELTWDKNVQQTTSFLFNRRGFTFLNENYDAEKLSRFPECAYKRLPKELKTEENTHKGRYDFDSALKDWSRDIETINKKFEAISEEPKKIARELVMISRTKKLREYCEKRREGHQVEDEKKKRKSKSDNLSNLSGWILDEWKKKGIKGLPDKSNFSVNLKEWLNKQTAEKAQAILDSLPPKSESEIQEKHLKNSVWNFKSEKFKLEEAIEKGMFDPPSDDTSKEELHKEARKNKVPADKKSKAESEYIKTHLNHLAFALYKIKSELESGGRHRSKYFEEIENVLKDKNHIHDYLKKFCKKLHAGEYQFQKLVSEKTLKEWRQSGNMHKTDIKPGRRTATEGRAKEQNGADKAKIEAKALSCLIGCISNFELKPLRKYFNDERHKNGDFWDERRLAEKFENWIFREWRVDSNKKSGYDKLKKTWKALKLDSGSSSNKSAQKRQQKLTIQWEKEHKDKLIRFFLNTDPILTIPPYQDNNNRRPPRCQSFILNPEYLNERYPDWQKWLKGLESLESVKSYLGDYKDQLGRLKSSSYSKKVNQSLNQRKNSDDSDTEKPGRLDFSYFSKLDQKNGKLSRYQRNEEYLQSRALQFIFDRVKGDDPLKLNEIYSRAKKYRQSQSNEEDKAKAKEQLEKAVEQSVLPENLKTERDYNGGNLFKEKSFLHLICKYYKLRRRAKDGRIFIHPSYHYVKGRGYEKTGRFDDENCLLSYCNRKPRQKRYQMLEDLAALLQIPSKKLKNIIERQNRKKLQEAENSEDKTNQAAGAKKSNRPQTKNSDDEANQTLDDQAVFWLNSIKGLKSNCDTAGKEQKERRGALKLDIQRIYGLIYHQNAKRPLSFDIKEILKNSQVKDAFKLHSFCERSKKLYQEIAKILYENRLYNQEKFASLQNDLKRNPAKAVYLLAQINNIAFKDRSGNASVCAVCSKDNALRMQDATGADRNNERQSDGSKAQRLPAVPTRIIDGAVKRMARIVGGAIAEDKWKKIKLELEKDREVRIPLITESNQFEFEPLKESLISKQRGNRARKGKALTYEKGLELTEKRFRDKEERIKTAGKGICPYTGRAAAEEGEIDHIIPRSSQWGTLNDEANLIWASREGNQHKTDNALFLSDLNKNYKQALFPNKSDSKIKEWIIEQIGDGQGEDFKFGRYRSFINLNSDEQKAFRHALFLKGCLLREKVIKAIDNRSRAFVNGTQRYFAEVLANALYKKAKTERKGWEKRLSFDYFGVRTLSDFNGAGFGIYNLRKQYEKIDRQTKEHKKTEQGQTSYSHLIDAQIAFAIAADAHKKEGSLKLKVPDSLSSSPSGRTLEKTVYGKIKLPENDCKEHILERRLPLPKAKAHSHRPLFNQNAVAMHFLKLIQVDFTDKEGEKEKVYLKGFWSRSEFKQTFNDKEERTGYSSAFSNIKPKIKPNLSESEGKQDKKDYAEIVPEKKLSDIKNLYKRFASSHSGKTVLKKFGPNKVFVTIYNLNKQAVYKFLMEKFNSKSDPSLWSEEDKNTFNHLKDLWYFTQKQNVIGKNGLYRLKEKDLKCAGFLNPQLKYAWDHLKMYIGESANDLEKRIKDYFCQKKNREKTILKHHLKTRKNFSLPIAAQKGFLIKKKNWKRKDIYYCRPASNDFSQTVGHKNGDDRLSRIYRKNNIFLADKLNELEKKLQPINCNSAVDPNKWHPVSVPKDLKQYVNKFEIKRTDEKRPHCKFHLSNKMPFEIFKKFISNYPFRGLNSKRKEAVEKCRNPEEMQNKIQALEKIKEEAKKQEKSFEEQNFLMCLKEYSKLWEQSQSQKIQFQVNKKIAITNNPKI